MNNPIPLPDMSVSIAMRNGAIGIYCDLSPTGFLPRLQARLGLLKTPEIWLLVDGLRHLPSKPIVTHRRWFKTKASYFVVVQVQAGVHRVEAWTPTSIGSWTDRILNVREL